MKTDAGFWMFRLRSGGYAKNRWGIIGGPWYYFDAEGRMLTGWQLLNNQWYYLWTVEDAKAESGRTEGAMATGWYFDPVYQSWFYFDRNGAMATGWREIAGNWYYFNPVSDGTRGAMAVNRQIEGWNVDRNGVWDGRPKNDSR